MTARAIGPGSIFGVVTYPPQLRVETLRIQSKRPQPTTMCVHALYAQSGSPLGTRANCTSGLGLLCRPQGSIRGHRHHQHDILDVNSFLHLTYTEDASGCRAPQLPGATCNAGAHHSFSLSSHLDPETFSYMFTPTGVPQGDIAIFSTW